ncbi:hypothetical protein ABZ929_16115 [Streptomyces physcomitrii]|uniref:hypothetical protein n=1 Tax=Streptomyces physcomitrii TaxID=2724184 RepID=UPI0033C5E47B
MLRTILGSFLALLGATAAVWSPFRAWYDGRPGRDFRLEDLFTSTGVSGAEAVLLGSLFLPFAVAAVVTLLGVILRSRLLVALAGVLVLGFTALWMVRQAQEQGSLTVAGDGTGLDHGAGMALGGSVLLFLGAALMRGRRASREPRYAPASEPHYAPAPDPGYAQPTTGAEQFTPYAPYDRTPPQEWGSPYAPTGPDDTYPGAPDHPTAPYPGSPDHPTATYPAAQPPAYDAPAPTEPSPYPPGIEGTGPPTRITWGSSAEHPPQDSGHRNRHRHSRQRH